MGYALFRDHGRLDAHFVESDILSTENSELSALEGKVNVLSISAVLHQWDWNRQLEAAKRLIVFTKPGSVIVGHHIGGVEGKQVLNTELKTYM